MDIELYEPLATAPRVPVALVDDALADAALPVPRVLHRSVARAVARGSDKTKRLRLERLARVVMSTDSRVADPLQVWAADFTALPVEAYEAIDAGIRQVWQNSVSTRNAMRDSVRSVVRESLKAGLLTHDAATPMLNALEPEKQVRDEEKQARGHVPAERVKQVFHELAQDKSLTARRDTALIALLVGAGLRREEAVMIDLSHLDAHHENVLVHGKGGTVRTVPLAPGVRRAIRAWLEARGDEPGPLITPLTRKLPIEANASKRMATNTVAQAVARRFGDDVQPHDLRRTFTGDLLESGADLSTVSKILGHVSPATTAGYDRRGQATRLAAVEKLTVPVEEVAC
ncbi:site-specific integrase [Microbacterium esteraromaticum]|uniref:tyrosine-type recombinase/integrase n=1 Tax=Microbacterium esteraromaticum TaxID=57043 RepID=UPI001CD59E64|nr:site-specific integrase [Microbacterium esteraromaticum]MCA1307989.1 site-specific integrase [Microbacterium esteraromaticum]